LKKISTELNHAIRGNNNIEIAEIPDGIEDEKLEEKVINVLKINVESENRPLSAANKKVIVRYVNKKQCEMFKL